MHIKNSNAFNLHNNALNICNMIKHLIITLLIYLLLNLIIHIYGYILNFKLTDYNLYYTAGVSLIICPFVFIYTYIYKYLVSDRKNRTICTVIYFAAVPILYLIYEWIYTYNLQMIKIITYEKFSPLLFSIFLGMVFPFIYNKVLGITR